MSVKEGWRAYVEAEPQQRPEQLSAKQIKRLPQNELEAYNIDRRRWHANFGIINTPQLQKAHDQLSLIVDADAVDSDRLHSNVVVDGPPGVGKTTMVNEFARILERRIRREHGDRTDEGHERIPVCRIGMTANMRLKPFNAALLDFYGHAGSNYDAMRRDELATAVKNCIYRCETEVIIVDDTHFIDPSKADGHQLSNHLKSLSNVMPVTFIMIGVDLAGRGLYSEGHGVGQRSFAQNGRRITPLAAGPFELTSAKHKREWKTFIAAWEANLTLANHEPGALVGLSEIIFQRTQGYVVSVTSLMTRACLLAIRNGSERIDESTIKAAPLDYSASAFWEGHWAQGTGPLA